MELDCIKLGFGPVCVELPNEPESIHFMQWLYNFPVVSVTKEIWLHLISTQLLCEATRQTFQSENESTSSSRPILPCDILQRILSGNRQLGPGQLGPRTVGPLDSWQHISNANIYITKCTFLGAQKPSNWHISPNCWYDLSNTNI